MELANPDREERTRSYRLQHVDKSRKSATPSVRMVAALKQNIYTHNQDWKASRVDIQFGIGG
jgi:hypothetical protein